MNVFGGDMAVMQNMLEPNNQTTLHVADIDETRASPTSLMPSGLLDTFTEDEILDLLAYLKSRGTPQLGATK